MTLVLLCAGQSTRMNLNVKKQWIRINGKPIWKIVLDKFMKIHNFTQIILVAHKNEARYMQNFIDKNKIHIVVGGETRQESIKNALSHTKSEYVCIHDSARICITKKVFKRLEQEIQQKDIHNTAPYVNIADTVFYKNSFLNRENIKAIQTPQISNTKLLKKALLSSDDFTDESSLMFKNSYNVSYVKGCEKLHKLTYIKDIFKIKCINKKLKKSNNSNFIGQGIDTHQFVKNKKMFLGGVFIESEFGFLAHSDGDVLIHSIIDALLGAIGAGDIGEFFPDTDKIYKDKSSVEFLKFIHIFLNNVGFKILNIDTTIVAQIPKINPHKEEIKTNLSKILELKKDKINIKATTSENMGFIGRSEGISVHSIANVGYIQKKDFKRKTK